MSLGAPFGPTMAMRLLAVTYKRWKPRVVSGEKKTGRCTHELFIEYCCLPGIWLLAYSKPFFCFDCFDQNSKKSRNLYIITVNVQQKPSSHLGTHRNCPVVFSVWWLTYACCLHPHSKKPLLGWSFALDVTEAVAVAVAVVVVVAVVEWWDIQKWKQIHVPRNHTDIP